MVFAFHCLLVSRESFSLAKQIGSTLPQTSSQNFKFAVFSDSHSCRTSLRDILKKASQRCNFAIHLGDFVEFDDDYEYRYFVTRIDDLIINLPLFLVRGNHETMAPDGGFSHHFTKYVPQSYYSFTFGGSLFCVVDNSVGKIDSVQRKILQRTLNDFRKDNPKNPIFLFMHIAPFDLGKNDSDYLKSIVNQFKINFVFAGDTHSYSEQKWEAATMIVSGCAGGSIHFPSTEVHYVEVTVTQSAITTQKIPAARDSMLVVAATYFLFVAVPRYRWYFFTGVLLLLMWEYYCYVRQK